MSDQTVPSTSPAPIENTVPLEPAKAAPGAEEKHDRIDKAIDEIDQKPHDNTQY